MTIARTLRPLAIVAAMAALALPAIADNNRHGGLTLYDGAGFRGEAVSFDGAVARLPSARFNDRAGSVSVSGSWELCSDSNFRGRCEIVSGDVRDLRRIGLNNNVSSIRPAGRGPARLYDRGRDDGDRRGDRGHSRRGADVVLFDGPRFEGRSLPINGAVPRLGDVRGNDKASSIAINRGTWLVCEHANFKGRCAVIDHSTAQLRSLGLNNNISSIKPHHGRRAGLYGGDHGGYSRDGW